MENLFSTFAVRYSLCSFVCEMHLATSKSIVWTGKQMTTKQNTTQHSTAPNERKKTKAFSVHVFVWFGMRQNIRFNYCVRMLWTTLNNISGSFFFAHRMSRCSAKSWEIFIVLYVITLRRLRAAFFYYSYFSFSFCASIVVVVVIFIFLSCFFIHLSHLLFSVCYFVLVFFLVHDVFIQCF